MTDELVKRMTDEDLAGWRAICDEGRLGTIGKVAMSAGLVHMLAHITAQATAIESLQSQLKVQKAVADLAYLPHQQLVDKNESLQAQLAAYEGIAKLPYEKGWQDGRDESWKVYQTQLAQVTRERDGMREALRTICDLENTESHEWDAVERVIPLMCSTARAALKESP